MHSCILLILFFLFAFSLLICKESQPTIYVLDSYDLIFSFCIVTCSVHIVFYGTCISNCVFCLCHSLVCCLCLQANPALPGEQILYRDWRVRSNARQNRYLSFVKLNRNWRQYKTQDRISRDRFQLKPVQGQYLSSAVRQHFHHYIKIWPKNYKF